MTLASAAYYAPYLTDYCGMSKDLAVTFTNYRGIICQLIGASLAARTHGQGAVVGKDVEQRHTDGGDDQAGHAAQGLQAGSTSTALPT